MKLASAVQRGNSAMNALPKAALDAAFADDPAERVSTNVTFVEQLYRSQSRSLLAYLKRKTGSPDVAAELLQETFVRVARSNTISEAHTPEAFLRVIARNLLIDRADTVHERYAALRVPLDEGRDAEDGEDQHRALESREMLLLCEAAIDKLRPKARQVFLLVRVEGYTYGQAAERLGMSKHAVKRYMMQAIAHIDRFRRQYSV